VYLRGHIKILKRLLIHTGGFNLGLLMRQLIGVGTPRGLQGRLISVLSGLLALVWPLWDRLHVISHPVRFTSPLTRVSTGIYAVTYNGVREKAVTTMVWTPPGFDAG
jgi:hypothetical protein